MLPTPLPLTRREALRRVAAFSVALAALELKNHAATGSRGLGMDPRLLQKEIPWERVLTAEEKGLVAVLGDLIIPADEHGPAASAVGVPDFIDEWVSAPYEPQQRDAKIIREGLAWLDGEAVRRWGKSFADAEAAQQTPLLDDIMTAGTDARKKGHAFFSNLRDKVTGGYYSTPEGWRAIGYAGNVPLTEFPGASAETIQHLGLA